ncbi:unnamed protein product [Closterium sp. NIES-64]|nr:unnamed protein product [Closterium sp. NIES-64]
MPYATCSFCEKLLKSYGGLRRHQRRNKKCLYEQDRLAALGIPYGRFYRPPLITIVHASGRRIDATFEPRTARDRDEEEANGDDGEAWSSAESAPSVASGESSDVAEAGVSRDFRLDIARIARTYFLPNAAITDIIQLFKAGNGDPSEVDMWQTYRDLERFEEEYLSYGDEWEIRVLELQEGLGSVTFRFRPLDREALQGAGIVAAVILFSDATHLTFNGRQLAHPLMFSLDNIPEASRWLEGGVEMVALFPPLPAALTPEQKTELMHEMPPTLESPDDNTCFYRRPGPILRSGGIMVTDHLGRKQRVFPLLSKYVCDHTESCMVTCTWAATSSQPCSMCLVSKWDLADLTLESTTRTVKGQKDVYERIEGTNPKKRKKVKSAWCTYFVKCALWEWAHVDTPWGNLYEVIGICIMHVVDEGVWLHTMRCLVAKLTPTEQLILLSQCEAVMAATPPSLLRHPDPSAYFGTVSQYAAWEHRAMMQIVPLVAHLPGHEDIARMVILFNEWYRAYFHVAYHTEASLDDATRKTLVLVAELKLVFPRQASQWRLPKVHLLRHLPHAIRMHGIPSEQSTNTYEALHKRCCKWPARNSNWRDVGRDIAVRHARNEAIRGMAREEGGRTYETAMRTWAQAVKHNTAVMTRRSRRMAVGDAQDPVWAEYGAALGRVAMDGIARVMQHVGIDASGVQVMARWNEWEQGGLTGHGIPGVHTALAIPPHDRLLGRGPGHMVKAAPGEGKFSYVSIDGGGGEWYARCLMLFHFMDDEAQIHRRAVVRYFDEHPTPCPVTGCVRLLPTEGEDEYAVVEVESILFLAHIVPCFTETRFSLVNRFLFDE